MKRRLLTATAVLALTLGVAGCGDDADNTAASSAAVPTTATPAPAPSATPTSPVESADGSGTTTAVADPADVLRAAGFTPQPFTTTEDLLSQTFPGLTATDPVCLQPFGSDWAADPSLAGSSMAWGATGDHGMAAAVTQTSSAELATTLLATMRAAVTTCAADGGAFSVHDVAVDITVAPIATGLDGIRDSAGWTATASVGGSDYTLVGMTARVDSGVAIVLSTSASTTSADVAAKLEQLTDQF